MSNAFIGTALTVATGALLAIAGSHSGSAYEGIPIFALCISVAFLMQWIAFIPAYLLQTEKFYDLTGSITYLTITAAALALAPDINTRSLLVAALAAIWAVRLGSFLFLRIQRAGSDRRFNHIKPVLAKFLLAWTLQGLWVSFTLAAGLAAMTASASSPLSIWDLPALLIWISGFAIEVIADEQKRQHHLRSANAGRFISTGLWAWSRHPNYFGEIMLWVGMALLALPALTGWQYVTLLSPVFVYLLLTRISGIPLLEAKAEATWGKDPSYRAYVARTPILVMRPPRPSR